MINAQTIVRAKYPDARCILGQDPKDDSQVDYYFIVADGEDDPVIEWGYMPDEAWDSAARKVIRGRFEAATSEAYQKGYAARQRDLEADMEGIPKCTRKHLPEETETGVAL